MNSNASVLEGARALENNQIGAVVIQDQGRVVGIVTDRDLTVRALGRDLDPKTTTMEAVMTKNVATLPPDATRTDAIKIMQDRRIRRIPLLENERVVGMVTLNDLLLDEAVSLEEAADVIRAQIGEGGPISPPRRKARDARIEASYRRFLNDFQSRTSLETSERTELALQVALSTLLRRLTLEEARDLLAQLPQRLRMKMQGNTSWSDRKVNKSAIESALVSKLDVDASRAAEILSSLGALLEDSVSAGQIEDVVNQLPDDLRKIFPSHFSPQQLHQPRKADSGNGHATLV
jgi:uncharacterized protein (DUF2267 family)/predicted transcriptional regulator